MYQLPAHMHNIAAFAARRAELEGASDAQLIAARQLFAIVERQLNRSQPRDGRGRYLSKAWLASAETFSAADRAWFRAPLATEVK